jgi:predicted RNA binding protein YcfA (HicA-like mRNA interferase family)
LSGQETVRVFEALGWQIARQRGSHIILVKPGQTATLSVPNHWEIAKGTLRSLIRSAELSVAEFVSAMPTRR